EPIATTCEVARMIASRLDMSPGVVRGLDYTYEHHDGSGFPNGAAAEEIPVAAHVAMVARDFEILYRLGGWDMVLEVAKKRRGRAYNPRVLDGFVAHALGQLEAEASETGWDAVMAADPSPVVLSGTRLTEALTCCADFADISSPFTLGYSHQVSDLAARAAGALRLDSGRIELVRCAALVQELGMSAVSRAVVDKAGPLTDGEWERVRLHPYFTERILARCPGLAPIGTLAGLHHERMDGSGYHRGTSADRLPQTASCWPPPGRTSLSPRGGPGGPQYRPGRPLRHWANWSRREHSRAMQSMRSWPPRESRPRRAGAELARPVLPSARWRSCG
ncbi:MAG TPA: HD domain-containing phosphohydrolase, partial [Actinomycetota bacterium]|nr:HD domain-containing phosphohydrolase [Actinomycetota bacterium]